MDGWHISALRSGTPTTSSRQPGERLPSPELIDRVLEHYARDNDGFRISAIQSLEFGGGGAFAATERAHPFSFHGRRHFTIETWISPAKRSGGGPILGNTGRDLQVGYRLSLAHGKLTVERAEMQFEEEDLDEETVEVVIEKQDVEVVDEMVEQAIHRWERAVSRVTSSHGPAGDRFTHVAVTYDGEQLRLYMDGKLEASRKARRHAPRSHHRFWIGGYPVAETTSDSKTPVEGDPTKQQQPESASSPDSGEPPSTSAPVAAQPESRPPSFDGAVGETLVWDRCLPEHEIRDSRFRRQPPSRHHLVARWPLEESDPNFAEDRSGNGNGLILGDGEGGLAPQRRSSLWIGEGRYYVDGELCENEQQCEYSRQPDDPGAVIPQPDEVRRYLAYLDVWDRLVNYIADPSIRGCFFHQLLPGRA